MQNLSEKMPQKSKTDLVSVNSARCFFFWPLVGPPLFFVPPPVHKNIRHEFFFCFETLFYSVTFEGQSGGAQTICFWVGKTTFPNFKIRNSWGVLKFFFYSVGHKTKFVAPKKRGPLFGNRSPLFIFSFFLGNGSG